ncbi:hypothetical protein D3C76_1265030 [compost metagenome]
MIKTRTFKQAAAVIVGFWVIAEVVMGFIRNPIDDTFTGTVAIINGAKATPVDSTMTLDMLDSGFLINKRPGIYETGARLTFDGKGVSTLTTLGLPNNFVEEKDRWQYQQGFCQLTGVKTDSMSNGLNPENLHIQRGILTFTSRGEGCMAFNVAITDFDHIEFSTYQRGYSFERKNVVYASLERDSRLSFIQRTIMRMRFESWLSDNPVFGKVASR